MSRRPHSTPSLSICHAHERHGLHNIAPPGPNKHPKRAKPDRWLIGILAGVTRVYLFNQWPGLGQTTSKPPNQSPNQS